MKNFKLKDDTGLTFKEIIDGVLENLMLDYNLNKTQARKVLGECLVRHCVYEEIEGEAEWLLGIEKGEEI